VTVQSIPNKPWLRGLVASSQPLAQPQGSLARLSNLLLNARGGLDVCDGSQILSAVDGVVQTTNQGRIECIQLFQPIGISPYFVDLQLDALFHLGAPTGLAVATGAAGSLAAATYFYVVTALDGLGGETTASSEVSIVNPGLVNNNLSWNPVNWASGYNIYRSTSTGTETLLASVSTNSFVDNGSIGLLGPYALLTSVTVPTGRPPLYAFQYTTSAPNPFKANSVVSISGVTPSILNRTLTITSIISPTTFVGLANSSGATQTGTGGQVTGQGSGSTITPPVADTTQVVVMRVLPVSQVSYNESSIVAIFPSSPGNTLVNPPGSSGGGGTTGGGGSGPGGGGGPVPGPGGGQLPVA
jgi:hypothetical protein